MRDVPTYSSPVLHDAVVQTLNALLTSYVEYLFGISHIGVDDEGETYPQVYNNDGSTSNVMIFPDNRVKSFCFWVLNGAEVLDDDDGMVYDLTFIFWGNLERIDQSKNYDHTSEIQQSILKVFKGQDVTELSYTQEDVFVDYTKYLEQERQTLMRPNTGFKISFKIQGSVCV
jgi:hypothetical protein